MNEEKIIYQFPNIKRKLFLENIASIFLFILAGPLVFAIFFDAIQFTNGIIDIIGVIISFIFLISIPYALYYKIITLFNPESNEFITILKKYNCYDQKSLQEISLPPQNQSPQPSFPKYLFFISPAITIKNKWILLFEEEFIAIPKKQVKFVEISYFDRRSNFNVSLKAKRLCLHKVFSSKSGAKILRFINYLKLHNLDHKIKIEEEAYNEIIKKASEIEESFLNKFTVIIEEKCKGTRLLRKFKKLDDKEKDYN
jgi:hypothetical protein